jgi:hypothetical protein
MMPRLDPRSTLMRSGTYASALITGGGPGEGCQTRLGHGSGLITLNTLRGTCSRAGVTSPGTSCDAPFGPLVDSVRATASASAAGKMQVSGLRGC